MQMNRFSIIGFLKASDRLSFFNLKAYASMAILLKHYRSSELSIQNNKINAYFRVRMKIKKATNVTKFIEINIILSKLHFTETS
jgi:hypothetical protein